MELEQLLEQVRGIADRVAQSEGFELVDVELHGRGHATVVRIFLDKPGGITVQDCQQYSRQVGAILDVEDVLATRYTLEVASPGLDRKLVRPIDFDRHTGRKAKFQLKYPGPAGRRFQGAILGREDNQVNVQLESGQTVSVSLDAIERANLVPEFGGKFGANPRLGRPRSR